MICWIFLLILSIISSLKLSSSPLHLMIIGPPCSGKGTQCQLLQKREKIVHVSSGDLLRQKQNQRRFQHDLKEGKLIPDSIMSQIVCERLDEKDCKEKGWILDGFPRTLEQAKYLTKSKHNIDSILLLNVPDDVVLFRGLGRCLDPVTGKIYHNILNPPSEDIVNRLVVRSDDTKETLIKRINDFKQQVRSIREYYGDKVILLDATQSPLEVDNEIEQIITSIKDRNFAQL